MTWQSPGAVAAIIAVVVAVAFVAVAVVVMGATPFGFVSFFFLPFCAIFVIIIVFVFLAMTQGAMRQPIPPPPPIQQRMVPAGAQGPIELNCPNCGAPPQNVDRFGVATCTYCNTRFLVR